jgi:hypothetical protein
MAIIQAGILQDAVVVLHAGQCVVLLNPAIYKRMPQPTDHSRKISGLKELPGFFLDAQRGSWRAMEVAFTTGSAERCHEEGTNGLIRIFQS